VLSALTLFACASDDHGTLDAGHLDMGSDAAEPTGTLLLAGSYYLSGQTTSGLLVVTDSAGALSTVDPKTAAVTQIAPKADGGAYVIGNVVFVSHDVDANYFGGLGVWTAASGYHDLGATNASLFQAYTDGTNIVYANNVDETTLLSDIVSDTVAHTNPKTLITQQYTSYGPLMPAGKVIIGHLASTTTTTVGPITSYDLTTGVGTDLIAAGSIYYTGNTQNTALFTTTSTVPVILDLTTGDQISLPALVTGGVFSADGKSLLANTSGNELEVITWSGTTPTAQPPVVTSGVMSAESGSPDSKHAIYYSMYDQTSFTSDLQLTSLSAPAIHATLAASGVSYGYFSNDSEYVALFTNENQTTYIGTVMVAPVSTGVPASYSTAAESFWFGGTGQLYIEDNYSTTAYTADLELADLTTPAAPLKKILKQIDSGIVPTTDNTTAYYTVHGGSTPGIYKIALP
jgi:hypothetical protein